MSYKDWGRYTLDDIAENIFSGGTPDTRKTDYWNGKLNWLSSGETRNTFITKTENTITELGVKESSTRLAKIGDIVIASAGQGFTRGQASLCKIDTYINQSLISIRCNREKAFNVYVFYNLRYRYEELRQISDGHSIRGSLTTKMMKSVDIKLPSLETQKAIANILSSLDDKIELNNKINRNLEELAQTLYKQWFVDFDFPNVDGEPYKSSGGEMVESELGLIPFGWKIGTIESVCNTVLGGTPSRKREEFWNGDINWINSGEVNQFRIIRPSEMITKKGYENSSTKLMPKKTTVIAITGATLGAVSLLEIDSCANQSVIGILQNDNIKYSFIYPTIKNVIHNMIGRQTGGAQQHINKNDVNSYKIVVPDKHLLNRFHEVVDTIYNEIANRIFQNQKVSKLRDELLPKLLSGEIEVPIEE